MPIWPYLVCAGFWALGAALNLRYLHMLQLASYQTPGYLRWLGGGGLLRWQPAKKPLKMTARAWRIFAVHLLLTAVPAAFGLWAVTAVYALNPLGILLANLLMLPVQKGINNGYIRDARKRLDAHPGLIIIGVTGSYGKTSVKLFLSRLLGAKYNVLATPESYNTPMGVVRTVRERLNATHEVFVCEMGARHVGDIRELCEIVRPRHGVLTSVGAQHLETFHTLENIARTKYELLDALPPDGIAFVQAGAAALGTPPGNAVRYGLSETPDDSLAYRAHGLSASAAGTSFTVTASDGWSQNFTTRLLGAHNVENLLGAIACARTLGVPPETLPGAVRGVEPVPHRLQLIPGDPMVIDDAFNANPKGAKAALDTLALFGGTKIIITPGMVELGERQAELNEAFGQQAAAVCDHVLLVGRKQTEPIAKGLGDFPNARVFDTFGEAFACAKALPGKDKVILLENDLPDNY